MPDYKEYLWSTHEKSVFYVSSYGIVFGICFLFYHSLLLSGVAAISVVFLGEPAKKTLASRRQEKMKSPLKDMFYAVSASIAAGRQMEEALEDALRSLQGMYQEENPFLKELSYIVISCRDNHAKETELLSDFADRSGLEDLQSFAEVYLVSGNTGADLRRVVQSACDMMSEKMMIEQEIRAMTSQKRWECLIITAMPVLVVLMLNLFAPDYISVMYESIPGRIAMTLALGGILSAYIISRRVMAVEV